MIAKKNLFFCLLILMLGSCSENTLYTDSSVSESDSLMTIGVRLSTALSDEPSTSRADPADNISAVTALQFDENGLFIKRAALQISTPNTSASSYSLQVNIRTRIIHFIADYDFSAFDDAAAMNRDEKEIVPALYGNGYYLWRRIVLPQQIQSGGNIQVELLRSFADVMIADNQSANDLTNIKFLVYNAPSAGTVAPFSELTNTFTEGVITEAPNLTILQPDASQFIPISSYGYLYEREDKTESTKLTFVMIQGTYQGETCYYKVELYNQLTASYYSIKRNTRFIIQINQIQKKGYTDYNTALNAPADNNLAASILIQTYTTVSDGVNLLEVGKTFVGFTQNGMSLSVSAKYATLAGILNNGIITVSLKQDPAKPVINGSIAYNPTTGLITGTVNNVPANNEVYLAEVKVKAGALERTIVLMLRSPYAFTNVSVSPNSISTGVNKTLNYTFTVPAISAGLFPIQCKITAKTLTTTISGVEIITEDGSYKYALWVYAPGVQTVIFTTVVSNSAGNVVLESPLFSTVTRSFTNGGD